MLTHSRGRYAPISRGGLITSRGGEWNTAPCGTSQTRPGLARKVVALRPGWEKHNLPVCEAIPGSAPVLHISPHLPAAGKQEQLEVSHPPRPCLHFSPAPVKRRARWGSAPASGAAPRATRVPHWARPFLGARVFVCPKCVSGCVCTRVWARRCEFPCRFPVQGPPPTLPS